MTPPPAFLRVAIDAGPLHGHRTGVGVAVAELSKALRRRTDTELRPYLISGRAQPAPGEHRLPLPGVVAAKLWSRSGRPRADRWLGDVDVVHGPNFVAPPSRHPTVVTVHDCWFLEQPSMAAPVVARAGRWLQRTVATGAFVHTPSAATAEAAGRLLDTDRVRVALLGPPPAGAVATVRPEGLGERSADIIAVGTEERRKGYPDLVRAFERLARDDGDANLVIAGAPGDDSDQITTAIARLDRSIAARVVRLGIITEAEKAWLLAHSRLLAYPSIDEGFGFPLLEANRAGRAIVARGVGSIPEVAGPSAVLVDDSDGDFADRFGNAMFEVLHDPALAARLGDAGTNNLARFSWDECARGVREIYLEAIEGRQR